MKEAVTKVIDTHTHKRTSIGPSSSCWNSTASALQPEEITSKGTRVSCVYYQYKSTHMKKKSGNLFNDPRIIFGKWDAASKVGELVHKF